MDSMIAKNMNIFKLIGYSILCVGLAFCGYLFFRPSKAAQLQRALEDVLQGEYKSAEERLHCLEESFPLALYRGYIAQAQGQFGDADLFFQRALKQSRDEEVIIQSLLAQAMSAYFEGREEALSPLLQRARRLSPQHSYLPFFEGLVSYLNRNFKDALHHWSAFSPPQEKSWFSSLFDRLFSTTWLQLHFAHSLAEEGDTHVARMILEREMHAPGAQEDRSLATLLLGLTYLKEGSQVAAKERESFYKLSLFYLEQERGSSTLAQEKQRLIDPLQKETLKLFDLPEHYPWGFAYAKLIEDWNGQKALHKIASRLAQKAIAEKDSLLCQAMVERYPHSLLHHLFSQEIYTQLAQCMRQGQEVDLLHIGECIGPLLAFDSSFKTHLASLVSEEIMRTIDYDSDKIAHILNCLDFWKKLDPDERQRSSLAHNLLTQGQFLWRKLGEEKKGIGLMEIALSLATESEKQKIRKSMESFLVSLYKQAESTNMVERLVLVYDALDHFSLGTKELVSPALLANHLADAEYLLKARNYLSTQTHAEWILRVDHKNQEAYRLLGLSSYHLGEYSRALAALKELKSPDEYSRKALILSKAFSAQEQESHLAQTENEDSFEEN